MPSIKRLSINSTKCRLIYMSFSCLIIIALSLAPVNVIRNPENAKVYYVAYNGRDVTYEADIEAIGEVLADYTRTRAVFFTNFRTPEYEIHFQEGGISWVLNVGDSRSIIYSLNGPFPKTKYAVLHPDRLIKDLEELTCDFVLERN